MIAPTNTSSLAAAAQALAAANKQAQAQAKAQAAQSAAAQAKLQQSQTALTTLKASGKSSSGITAQQAKAKLDALKERLKTLMMLGGDPKTVARQAAQIAKEISQTAKDYADAVGASAASVPAPAPTPTPPAASPTTDPNAQAPDGQAPADATGQAAGADSQAGSDSSQDAEGSTAPAAASSTSSSAPSGGGAPLKQPDPVIEEAKILAASAKSVMKGAIERARHEHKDDPEFGKDQATMDQADKDIAAAAKIVDPPEETGGYTPSAAQVPAADPAPTVSVQV